MRVKELVTFMEAREQARMVREAGTWEAERDKLDPIIAAYRFCNVKRNDDRVTKWIHQHYLSIWRNHRELWFALVVARLFNNPETLAEIADTVIPFQPAKMLNKLRKRRERGDTVFNAAYIVSTNGRAMDKLDYVVVFVLRPLWLARAAVSDLVFHAETLRTVQGCLLSFDGLGSFMAAQVIGDLKYARQSKWSDFHTFVAPGPGSLRGMNRLLGRGVDERLREDEFRANLLVLQKFVNELYSDAPLTAQDIQNCLCEFDKYERARLGEGRPKQKYTPKENKA